MAEVLALVEGPTEETFFKHIITPHLEHRGVHLKPIIVTTNGSIKGGLSKFAKVETELRNLRRNPNIWITTMFDFYGLPSDFPGHDAEAFKALTSSLAKVRFLEGALSDHLLFDRFIPFFMLHEFEAILFSDVQKFSVIERRPEKIAILQRIRDQFETPEDINNNPNTAPSKRILQTYAEYQKPFHGLLIAQQIGLSTIREQCSHFSAWLGQLEALGADATP